MIDFSATAGAMQAFGTAMQVTANNIANVNTEEFKASRTTLEEIPNQGGARVQDIMQTTTPGPLVPVDKPVTNQAGQRVQAQTMVQASNTETSREMVNMMSNQNAFSANVAVIRTKDDMIGGLLDEIA